MLSKMIIMERLIILLCFYETIKSHETEDEDNLGNIFNAL